MKKSKLSIGLVTSFIATMALSACGSSVTKDNSNVVDFKGYGDQDLAVSIQEIYEDYMQSSTGIAKYYDQVIEVLIRHAFQKDKDGSSSLKGIKKNYNQIVNDAKDDVKGAKDTAKSNAETNGTSYKTEWQAILSEKGVKDEEELLQYYIYQKEKTEIEDWYYQQHEDELRREYLGVWSSSKEGAQAAGTANPSTKASSRYPYHIRHILVKNEDGASDYVRGTVSAEAAKRLSEIVQKLADGQSSFGAVAKDKSEDSSSSSYGDVGLMTNAITVTDGKAALGMVKEFQLGIYAYDAIIKNSDKSDAIDEGLGLNTKVHDAVTAKEYFTTERKIVEIPYSVFVELGDVADLESNYSTGLSVAEGKAAVFPRNLLWNRYLNNHGIFVITNGKRETNYAVDGSVPTENTKRDMNAPTDGYFDPEGADTYTHYETGVASINYANLPRFKANAKLSANANARYLSDEKDNLIIGVRSQFGIHLMIVEKSAYDFDAAVKLEDYYTTLVPTDQGYPTVPAGDHTYVDFINTKDNEVIKSRAEAVKSAIKGFDSTYDYRLYEELKTWDGIDSANETNKKLFNSIQEYIDLQREKNQYNQIDGIEEVWKSYYELLETQYHYRHDLTKDRVIPEGCKIAFTKTTLDMNDPATKALFSEGGYCYGK